jgi:L-asparaginase II
MSHKCTTLAVPSAAALLANLLLGVAAIAAPANTNSGIPALYPSQAEAEKAAKLHFNCSGAHKMGNQWMPCATHGNETTR